MILELIKSQALLEGLILLDLNLNMFNKICTNKTK